MNLKQLTSQLESMEVAAGQLNDLGFNPVKQVAIAKELAQMQQVFNQMVITYLESMSRE